MLDIPIVDLLLRPLLTTLVIGFTTVLLFLWYSTIKQNYWKKLGVPYVKPLPFLGSILENINEPLHELESKRYKKYGRLYGYYEGNSPLLSIGEPKILRDILVKDFHAFTGRRKLYSISKIAESMLLSLQGDDWKRVRAIVTPTFTTGKIKRMLGIFKECSRTLIDNFKEAAIKGEYIEAKRLYGAFTMDVIASSAFSIKIDSHNDPNNRFVQNARSLFARNFNWKLIIFILFPKLLKFLGLRVGSSNGFEFFTTVIMQMIEERKKTGQARNDFLQLLLDTSKEMAEDGKLDTTEKDDIMENYGKDENDQNINQTIYTKKTLSREELVAQCVIFFLAGYETTATTLSFVSYCLALNPDIQEKLIQELDVALIKNNGELTYEVIQSLKYLDNVISETLRLYPPATRVERVADEDYKLGDTGLTIPKDMIISIPVHAMHRDPTLFADPEKFDPDRFSPEERAKRDQYSYLPFGAGPRNCIGMRFALMEIKVCLAHVLSNYRFKRCSQTKVPLDFYPNRGLVGPKEITLALEERKDTVLAL